MKRLFDEAQPEWMDQPNPDPAALELDLHNLEKINRWFGGRRAVRRLWERVGARRSSFSLIDLATGFGDHPRALVQAARRKGQILKIYAVDRQYATLQLARKETDPGDGIFYIQADVRALPFKDASVDGVFCTLALHHFGEGDAIQILREMKRLGRQAVVCLDLERSWLAVVAIWLLTVIWMRNPMTRHDARLSVRRAFSEAELKLLAGEAGWSSFWHARFRLFRQAIGREESSDAYS
jgi:ubiquinone/menaquinone biosynthesis C-methylase UbiE